MSDLNLRQPIAPPQDIEWEIEEQNQNDSGINFDIYSPYRVDLEIMKKDQHKFTNFLNKIRSSSEKTKDLLMNPETIEFLMDIYDRYELAENQSSEISRIIRDILLRDSPANDLGLKLNQLQVVSGEQIIREMVKFFDLEKLEKIEKVAATTPQNPQQNTINLRDQ